ncbi:hypothetical protein MACJ_000114 [Theileria orientalis]|uniref:Uncharacterized protein n=1 Tax=Theileria orientalis TaxID=68886 RepID=A0A976QUB5_THEOR|nr:hypothetical protein MACJ_000114 [Theileria orientalis]
MDSNQENSNNHSYYNYQVPDLMSDPEYLRDLGSAKTYREDIYFSTEDFDEDYSDHFMTKGIKELVETIHAQDEYRYSNYATTSNLFQKYLETMTNLKDLLLPKSDGAFHEKWIEIAVEFQRNCEDIFLRHVKQEYILTFLPMVPKQLEYTSMKLKELALRTEREQENFKNLYSLIALGFIGKMKLLSFYLSLTAEGDSSKQTEPIDPEIEMMKANQIVNYQNPYSQIISSNALDTIRYEGQYPRDHIYEMGERYEGVEGNFDREKSQSYRGRRSERATRNMGGYNYKLRDDNGDQVYDIIEDDDEEEEYTVKKREIGRRKGPRRARGRKRI